MKLLQKIINASRFAWQDAVMAIRYALNLPYPLHSEVIQSPSKPRQTYIFIHGIGNTLQAWSEVYEQMPKDVRIIGVDLLGFGKSPKPYKAVYSARLQARSVMRTLLAIPGRQRPIIVGHSLGALVAVELARRYPLLFKHIVLCSPPLYTPEDAVQRGWFSKDRLLRRLYRTVRLYPDQLERVSAIAVRAGVVNRSFTITQETLGAYMASLESSIVNQSALSDIPKVKVPVTVFYGVLDPFVVGANIQALTSHTPSVAIRKITAGHEVVGRYARRVAEELRSLRG